MAGTSHNEYEAPVAGDGVRYMTHDGSVVEGVLAEVYRHPAGGPLRARVCSHAYRCMDKLNGLWLDYCRLRRIPGS